MPGLRSLKKFSWCQIYTRRYLSLNSGVNRRVNHSIHIGGVDMRQILKSVGAGVFANSIFRTGK